MRYLITAFLLCNTINLWAQIPSNDDCSNAQSVIIPASGSVCITSSNQNATSDNSVHTCDQGAAGNEVWFSYIVNGSENTITVSPTGSNPATFLIVTISSSDCSSGLYTVCDKSATANGSASVNNGFVIGQQVWISVETESGNDGDFELCITSSTPPPSPGEECATATIICDKTDWSMDDMSTVTASGEGPPSCFEEEVFPFVFVPQPLQQDVWIKFTVGKTGTLEFTGTPQAATEFDWAIYDVTSGCLGTEVACNYNYTGDVGATFGMISGGTGEFSDAITVTAGNTYAIVIDNYTKTAVGFDFSWGGTFEMATTSIFSATPTSGCSVPVDIAVTNTSTGASTYTWNYGDGFTTNDINPAPHTYTSNGDYLISLLVEGPTGCTNISSTRINLNAGPVITINPTPAEVCPGASLDLTANLSLGTPLDDFSFTKTENVVIPNNNTSGISSNINSSGMANTTITSGMVQSICFTINHTKHSDISRNDPNALSITVNGNTYYFTPLNLPNVNGTASYCFPNSVLSAIEAAGGNSNTAWTFFITDLRGGGGGTGSLVSWEVILRDNNSIVSYNWSPTTDMTGSGTLTPSVSPTADITYALTAEDAFGCITTKSVDVSMLSTPTATISGDDTICSSGNATISVALTGTAPWSITYTDGVTPTTVNGIMASPYTFTTSSTATYSLVSVSDADCDGTVSGSATISINPDIIISNIQSDCSSFVDFEISFEVSGGDATTYSVTGDAGTLTSGTPYTFLSNSIPNASNYNFIITDALNCNPQTVSGFVDCGCGVTADVTGGGSVCTGFSAPDVVFNFSGGSGTYDLVYSIDGIPQAPENGIASTTFSISSPGAGTYAIVSVSDGVCSGTVSGSATVTFFATPTATVSGDADICNDGSTTQVQIDFTGTAPFTFTYALDGTDVTTINNVLTSPYLLTVSTAGLYNVSAISDANTCLGNSLGDATINLLPLPAAIIDANNGPICAGQDAIFDISGTTDAILTYNVNSGSSGYHYYYCCRN